MNRPLWLGLLVLTACAAPHPPVPAVANAATPVIQPASPGVCRFGPGGARPLADRGIGGTGSPVIGEPQTRTADRGIGGTGIIGVVTGFASICVAGEEVALPPTLPALIDGRAGTLDDLRAGQVVAVQAAPAGDAGLRLLAREIVIRHAVIGPVQAVGDGTMTVAGQQILLADATGAATGAQPGQFVAVSGLRRPGGTVAATRVDPAPPGPVLLRGELVRSYGTARIGAQIVQLPPGVGVPGGFPVVATGVMERGVLVADSVVRDEAEYSPATYFGTGVSNFVVEGYWSAAAGGYYVRRDFIRGGGFLVGGQGRGIAVFSRIPGGGFEARGGEYGAGAAPGAGGGYGPAPVPRGGGGRVPPGQGGGDFGGPGDRFRQGGNQGGNQGNYPRGGARGR